MPMSREEARDITIRFATSYRSSLAILFRFEQTTADLYGPNAPSVLEGMKGAYLSKQFQIGGRTYQGRLDIPLANIRDADDLVATLRHEVLGHFGLNTLEPEQKRAVLDGLIDARDEPSLKPIWAEIDRAYAGQPIDIRAEEVWSAYCEDLHPAMHQVPDAVSRGQRAFAETCDVPQRAMSIVELHDIACMVAEGLRTGERVQRTFPTQGLPNYRKKEDSMEAKEPKKPFHELVAERLIEQLKAGTAPWQKPWQPGPPGANMPMNPTTGNRYKGINAVHLMMQGRSDTRWMTYNQAAAAGAQVRKGERSTPVQYWKFKEEQVRRDANGVPVRDKNGEVIKDVVDLERPRVFMAAVFNAEQIDGLPPIVQRQEQAWDAHERAERILTASGAQITHAPGDRAYYRPSTDSITMPFREQFGDASRYYATALHELGHWTGHPTRLDRDLVHPFGSEGYAREELRAEIASMLLGDELGIGHDPGQHVAYVASWIKALQQDPLEVFRAAADSEKIHKFVMGFENVIEQVVEQERPQQINQARPLDVSITAVVHHESVSFDHYVAHPGAERGISLDEALIEKGLGTVEAVVGTNTEHAAAYQHAFAVLSKFYGIPADYDRADNLYLERKGLSEQFADVAVELHQAHVRAQSRREDERVAMQVPDQPQEIGRRAPHELTFAQFAREASVQRLHGDSKKWQVSQGDWSSFSDEPSTDAALREAHRGAVDSALFLNSPSIRASSAQPGPMIPPAEVLAEYSDLMARHQSVVPAETRQQASDIARRAEAWVLRHVDNGSLKQALDGASLAQVERAASIVADMLPANTQNEFWSRHTLPLDVDFQESLVFFAKTQVEEGRLLESGVSATLRDLRTGKETDPQEFHNASRIAFGFTLPADWTGAVRIVDEQVELQVQDQKWVRLPPRAAWVEPMPQRAANVDEQAQELSIIAANARADGLPLPGGWTGDVRISGGRVEIQVEGQGWVQPSPVEGAVNTRPMREPAEVFADELAIIDANAQSDEFQKVSILARVQEGRVLRDPSSTPEDVAVAKEARRSAEANALVASDAAETATRDAAKRADEGGRQVDAERHFISVPMKEKDEAKSLGARWDRDAQSWYVPDGVGKSQFARWDTGMPVDRPKRSSRQYLVVPFHKKNQAKAAGAMWDKARESWYVGPRADVEKLRQWLPENVTAQQMPATDPREEFIEQMRAAGLAVGPHRYKGEVLDHPVMDGKRHRVPVDGGKRGSADGFYIAGLDGHPAGRIINNKTGVDITWRSKGYVMSDAEKTALRAKATEHLAARAGEQDAAHEATAKRVAGQIKSAKVVEASTPYLDAKGVGVHHGVLSDKKGQTTYIPAYDIDGKTWTMQYIQDDGTKRFAKGGKKEGCFHVVGGGVTGAEGLKALAAVPVLVVGEGYATAAELKKELQHPTVAAFDSGNLLAVVQALHKQFPDKPILVAGDDDRHVVMTTGSNPGRVKAEEAARAVGGRCAFPVFSASEAAYPSELPVITPSAYKAHLRADEALKNLTGDEAPEVREQHRARLLTAEQLAALDHMKRFTDFNDLKTKSELGQEGLTRQVKAAVAEVQQNTPLRDYVRSREVEQPVEKVTQQRRASRGKALAA